jgi:hypothetical protein
LPPIFNEPLSGDQWLVLTVIAVNNPEKVLLDGCLSKPGISDLNEDRSSWELCLKASTSSGNISRCPVTPTLNLIPLSLTELPHMLSFTFIEVGNIHIACYLAIV